MTERQDNQVEEADQIYLLMKEDYRISRNVRLAWFVSKLNQIIWPASTSGLQNSENELDLVAVQPKGWQPISIPTTHPCVLMPTTRATFLARRYRFIIELDLSPSTGIVAGSVTEPFQPILDQDHSSSQFFTHIIELQSTQRSPHQATAGTNPIHQIKKGTGASGSCYSVTALGIF
ncbi:hypothetical protein CRENBAI_008325 [Crenichthys baileyi]|uniref:Uncharacterized protein n=1 Tax=Crenichthys baileyi TaxID=28760 RepID=A0AAV9QR36_9TELE